MLDFLMVSENRKRDGSIELYPKFIIGKSSDLMIRGGDFYAVWDEEKGLWSTDEQDVFRLIDAEVDKQTRERYNGRDGVYALHMWDAESGLVDNWHKYCWKQLRDNYSPLDENLMFSNSPTNKKDYSSKRLPYSLEEGSIQAYDRLISVLYSPEERRKIEWAIGAIVTGDAKDIQKFLVFYGSAGTGKSTVLNIIQKLFEGYYSVFDAKALGSANSSFALEPFKTNPLVAIQHDGDLSKIEDNTRLNSLVSHEYMTVNEKFKSAYTNKFNCMLFMGTNRPVKITDSRSGIIRRLIDVSPSGNKVSPSEYKRLTRQIEFEIGAIAYHCKEVYLSDPGIYDTYVPTTMMGASNDFYNFVAEYYMVFKNEDAVTLSVAWKRYKDFCEETKVPYPYPQRIFKEELKSYFKNYAENYRQSDGTRLRNYYYGFKTDKFEEFETEVIEVEETEDDVLKLDCTESIFDSIAADYPAQYASENETPVSKWENTTTKLSDLDTKKLHYVRVPENHIVIDFDIKGKDGKKNFKLNAEAASKWPQTYAELSKGGEGIHLHYLYSGDVSRLSRIYDDNIEIKVFTGLSSLRRRLSRCNNLPIATINSGLPMRGDDKMVDFTTLSNEKALRTVIKRNLNKEYHGATTPSVSFIKKILDDAYNSGMAYDVTDMKSAILSFAAGSTNQSAKCIKMVGTMKFKSEVDSQNEVESLDEPKKIVFYDVEVFPNLFLINWKLQGKDKPVVRMINPASEEVEKLSKFDLIGFNCRRYDNHMLYARMLGYSNQQLYDLSQRIVSGDRNAFFGEAYNLSYTDIYDFSAKKQSLKKWEIELGLHHQELGLPWDEPVPEEKWNEVAEYCDNDVISTEATFEHLKNDFTARKILADIADSTVNDTSNSLTTKIIFGKERNPQGEFNYRDMGDVSAISDKFVFTEDLTYYNAEDFDEYTVFDKNGRPIFPGYKFDHGKSEYRGEDPKEGGYVYSEPGMYRDVALLDIASMHPHSAIAEELFGPVYTARYKAIIDARIAFKHKDWDAARTMLDGKLAKYVDLVEAGEIRAKDVATALKIPINSVYGLTSASFSNAFRDPRNVDNIVAKRGALFMINLKHEVQKRGFTVAHIKTDSIKIPNATPEIIEFVMDYGKMYGYTFEHEATYERMCLVNNAVYIAKYNDAGHEFELSTGEKIKTSWTATGAQFQIPYVFKTLFSKSELKFEDMCETKSVTSALYLDMNEGLPEDEHKYHFIGKVGLFCPVLPGAGGGLLMREKDGKYNSATGAKGYRWMEAEMVKMLDKYQYIDRRYYNEMVDEAVKTISEFGDFEWFAADDDVPWYTDEDDQNNFNKR